MDQRNMLKHIIFFQAGLPLKLLPLMVWNRPTAEAQPIQPNDGTQTGMDDPSAYTLHASAISAPFQDASPLPPCRLTSVTVQGPPASSAKLL